MQTTQSTLAGWWRGNRPGKKLVREGQYLHGTIFATEALGQASERLAAVVPDEEMIARAWWDQEDMDRLHAVARERASQCDPCVAVEVDRDLQILAASIAAMNDERMPSWN